MTPGFNKGIKTLVDAKKALEKVVEVGTVELSKYTFEALSNLEAQIAAKEEQLGTLTQDFKERERQANITLKLNIQENEKKACETYASKHSYMFVSKDEYNDTLNRISDVNHEIEQAVNAEKTSSQRAIGAATNNLKLQHQAETAQMKAQLASANNQVIFLNEQLAILRKQLQEAGENAVKIAQSNSMTVVNEMKK